jgi:hypothetical protein
MRQFFVECQRCGAIRTARSRAEQKHGKYCSRKCSNLVNQNIRFGMPRGVANSARARRLRVVARVQHLTPVEAFRLGYVRGLYSKLRQVKRRYRLVPIEAQG